MGIRVRALQLGFYDNQRRREGDEFEISDEKHLGKWMKRLGSPRSKKADTPLLEKSVTQEDVNHLEELAAELEQKAFDGRSAVKGNSPKTFKEEVMAMEVAAAEARTAADDAKSSLEDY